MSIGPNHWVVLAIPIDARNEYPSFSTAPVSANVAPLSKLTKWKSEQVLKVCRTLRSSEYLITRGKRGALAGAPRVGFVLSTTIGEFIVYDWPSYLDIQQCHRPVP